MNTAVIRAGALWLRCLDCLRWLKVPSSPITVHATGEVVDPLPLASESEVLDAHQCTGVIDATRTRWNRITL